MRRSLYLALIVVLAGCKIPTAPDAPRFNSIFYTGYSDFYLLQGPLPGDRYDAVFWSEQMIDDYRGFSGQDTTAVSYRSGANFYNTLGDQIAHPSDSLRVAINGDTIRRIPSRYFDSYDTSLNLAFPQSVQWTFTGNSYFPSCTHSVKSEPSISIISPRPLDTLSVSSPCWLQYSILGTDNATITKMFWGIGRRKVNDSIVVDSFAVIQRQSALSAVDSFPILPFRADQQEYISFTPKSLDVTIAWAIGDSVHVGKAIYGFVTESERTTEYFLKP